MLNMLTIQFDLLSKPGKTQVEQGDIGSAYVRIASGRRGNTGTDFRHGMAFCYKSEESGYREKARIIRLNRPAGETGI
jgi:hypothetical protein